MVRSRCLPAVWALILLGLGSAAAAQDFENGSCGWSGLRPSTDVARSGAASGHWLVNADTPLISRSLVQFPDGEFAGVHFSLYSRRANGARVIVRLDAEDPGVPGLDYYGYDLVIDWEGWRDFSLPLYSFYAARRPQRARINQVVFAANFLERWRQGTDLYLDDFRIAAKLEGLTATVDDMEAGVRRWSGLKPAPQPVRRGSGAGLWESLQTKPIIQITRYPRDWSEFAVFCVSIYEQSPAGVPLSIIVRSEDPGSPGEDYYRYDVPLDWTGWRDIQIPLLDFKAVRSPQGWQHISALVLAANWDDIRSAPNSSLVIDEVMLAREIAVPEVVLDDLESGVMKWQGLKAVRTPVLRGAGAGQWRTPDGPGPRLKHPPADWRPYETLTVAVYSPRRREERLILSVRSDAPETGLEDGWTYQTPLQWTGWRKLAVPLAEMQPCGSPVGWGNITGLSFAVTGASDRPGRSDLTLDELRLVPAQQPRGHWRRVLDDLDGGVRRWRGLTPQTELVAQGRASGLWSDLRATPRVSFSGLPADISGYTHFCLSIYCAGSGSLPAALTFMFDSDDPDSASWDYYRFRLPLTWRGWRHVAIPLRECQPAEGTAPLGWQAVRGLHLIADAAGPSPPDVRLAIDNVYLDWRPLTVQTESVTPDGAGGLKWTLVLRNAAQIPLAVSPPVVVSESRGVRVTGFPQAETVLEGQKEQEFSLAVTPAASPAEASWGPLASCTFRVLCEGQVAQLATAELPRLTAALQLPPLRHPRLLLTPDRLPGLRQTIGPSDGSEWRDFVERVRRRSEIVVTQGTPAALANPEKSGGLAAQAASVLASASFIEVLEPTDFWLKRSRELFEIVRRSATWVLPSHSQDGLDDNSATTGMLVGLSYDWLSGRLSEAERVGIVQTLDARLLSRAKEAMAAGKPYLWRPEDGSCATILAGTGAACLTVLGELPAASALGADCYRGLLSLLNTAPASGGWSEGPSYWLRWLTVCAVSCEALEQMTGGLMPLGQHVYFARTGDFGLYMTPDQGGFFTLGDSGPTVCSRSPLMWLARRQADPQLADFAARQPPGDEDWLNLVWGQPLPGAVEYRERPSSRLFGDLGWAVLRSGWSADDLACFVRSGPLGPHGHLDAGAISLNVGGTCFVRDLGRDTSGSPDYLDAAKRWTCARATSQCHNTLLLNGAGQIPTPAGGTVARFLAARSCDFLSVDASACYQGAKKVTRTLLLAKPGYLLIRDRVEADGEIGLSARFHLGADVRIARRQDGLALTAKTGAVRLSVISPSQMHIQEGQHDANSPFFDIVLPRAAQHDLLMLLQTAPSESIAPDGRPAATVDDAPDARRVRIDAGPSHDTLELEGEQWRWLRIGPQKRDLCIFCSGCQLVTDAARAPLMRSSIPVTGAATWTSNACEAHLVLPEDGTVELSVREKVKSVYVDGVAATPETVDKPLRVRLELSEGGHEVLVDCEPVPDH